MSIRIMTQVWELDLPHNTQSILLALADHADDDGFCYPSVGRLAWKTGYGVRQVQRTLKELRDQGLAIATGSLAGGRYNTVVYKLDPGAGRRKPAFEPKSQRQTLAEIKGVILSPFSETPEIKGDTQDVQRVSFETERVSPESQKGDTAMSPKPSGTVTESSIEPSRAKTRKPAKVYEYPDWFQPLTKLEGFKAVAYDHAMEYIPNACQSAGVSLIEVVKEFVQYYTDGGKLRNGWKTPVKPLVNTIDVQINKTRNRLKSESFRSAPATASVNSTDFSALEAELEARRQKEKQEVNQ